ncbi:MULTISPECIES: GpE family phage tail protein [unclassified Gilliamella]|nr:MULTISPECIES: GpE family phage tail protein [Gilliamella]MCX8642601.1 GpE family phage tail protein [Gilliamella sp. B3835]MCX8706455.1 GpE family phage tail protein [Gilliamella sp. B3783]MCX8709202.1 GpE family phage tail protein [Gilliamella sp. B3780]MCX8712239.1 GpE family phage tail protein [Gilliamella sp. B3468]MCX8714574.1 GpE family phage tail protein [Gilliamella sp. B3781]
MADIALIFHWQPSEMYKFTLTELMEWQEQACQRNGTQNG